MGDAITTVAVRELCEFTAKCGDLDLRFTPAPSAEEGIEGHATVARRRGSDYQREVRIEGQYETLKIKGRADGYRPHPVGLEEIKTHRGPVSRIPENHRALHWAQLKMYGALHCRAEGLNEIELTLTYFDIDREKETPDTQVFSAAELEQFLTDHAGRYLEWWQQEQVHQQRRNAALDHLTFPHAEFHSGQRALSTAVFRAAREGECVMAQAPTGIGKTIGTLFPALKAVAKQHLDKVYFLTAKTSGRQVAMQTAAALRTSEGALPLRVLELVARDKSCEHRDKACHGDSCPLAKGFYDRLPAARADAVTLMNQDQASVRSIALAHGVCPYYLTQDLTRWADVIVGDYNYYFDRTALLHGLKEINEWRVGVLVDEAHNLVERGRGMYSTELEEKQLRALRSVMTGPLRKALDRLLKAWNAVTRDQTAEYQTYPEIPEKLTGALHKTVVTLGEWFADHPSEPNPDLQRFYFDALSFLDLADAFADHSLFEIRIRQYPKGRLHQDAVVCIRNVVPAPFLASRISGAASTIAFSATLSPYPFYRDLLGMPDKTHCLDVESPFSPDQLTVKIAGHISTRFPDRAHSLIPIADLIAEQFRLQPGNYLAFFSSFSYLDQVADVFAERHPEQTIWRQSRGMDEGSRKAFLDQFTLASQGIGFAVLGGVFAEGIDLPGARLVGAFVATLGLPQVNPVTEELRARLEALFGQGYDYAYLYPGLQKVVQAAGRVIRNKTDQGTVYLIDDRFKQRRVRELLPRWWSPADNA